MAAVVNGFAISGIDGYVVKIETDTIYWLRQEKKTRRLVN